jgi:hypothetical protein
LNHRLGSTEAILKQIRFWFTLRSRAGTGRARQPEDCTRRTPLTTLVHTRALTELRFDRTPAGRLRGDASPALAAVTDLGAMACGCRIVRHLMRPGTRRRCRSPVISVRSRHSRRALAIQRSAIARIVVTLVLKVPQLRDRVIGTHTLT